jgi:hypothetical protein
MPRRTIRSLLVLAVIAAIGGATAAAPAPAYTPPIGSDKGSIVLTQTSDIAGEPLVRSGTTPAADGIIAVLIGLVQSNDGP